jgi:hypothetical protein
MKRADQIRLRRDGAEPDVLADAAQLESMAVKESRVGSSMRFARAAVL